MNTKSAGHNTLSSWDNWFLYLLKEHDNEPELGAELFVSQEEKKLASVSVRVHKLAQRKKEGFVRREFVSCLHESAFHDQLLFLLDYRVRHKEYL